VRGVEVDWAGFDRDYPRRKVVLPTYPFQRREYRLGGGPPDGRPSLLAPDPAAHPLLGRRVRSPLLKETLFESTLGTDALPFLADHRVRGLVIVPGAALLEMASAAAEEVLGPSVLEDVVIQEALVLPPEGARIVQLVVFGEERERRSFRIISLEPVQDGGQDGWRLHASGLARAAGASDGDPGPAALASLRARCADPMDVGEYYRWLADAGIELGPALQGLEELWQGAGEALARIRVPQATAASPRYGIDPTLLDAGLSTLGAALPRRGPGEAYVPMAVESFRRRRRAGASLWSHARLRQGADPGRDVMVADVTLLDADGRVVVELVGLQLKRVGDRLLAQSGDEFARWFYSVEWRPRPRAVGPPEAPALASPAAIAQRVEPKVATLAGEHRISDYDQVLPALDELCSAYVAAAFRELGWMPRLGDRLSTDALVPALGIKDQHRRLVGRMLEMLCEDGVLREVASDGRGPAGAEWEVMALPGAPDPEPLARALAVRFPEPSGERELTVTCGRRLGAVLRGDCDPLGLLFPGGSFAAAEKLYRESPSARVFQALVREAVAAAVESLPTGRPIRVLEVGAGTGGTTAYVLPALPRERTEYTFTDISPLFPARARDKFASYPFVRFETLDIEQDPLRQGFAARSYDIVLAANVLHATRDLRETLSHVSQLLAPGGLLVLVEVAARQRWVDLTFGLLGGWWRFADSDLRPSYPLLSHERWLQLLGQFGFIAGAKIPRETAGARILAEHGIVLARAPREAAPPAGRWLVLADRGGVGEAFAGEVEARGGRCTVEAGPTPIESLPRIIGQAAMPGEPLHVVHLRALDASGASDAPAVEIGRASEHGVGSALELVKALARAGRADAARLWLVTRGAQAVGAAPAEISVGQSPIWGLGKVIALEHPELACVRVDLDPAADAGDAAAALAAELLSPDGEDQIALRAGVRYVARLVRSPIHPPTPLAPSLLRLGRPGVLDELTLAPLSRRSPGRGEVEIEIHATGLNFRDVLNALGMRADEDPLGGECAGRVVAVGEGVSGLREGDDVVAVAAGCFASFVTTGSDLVLPKPTRLSFEEAASVPLAFLTAQHALVDIAGMKAGEKVLIHAAAGGVGLAAVQLAQRAQAEVFATAGSPAKRDFLRSLGVRHVTDSRSLDFAREVLEATGGRGVDIVLNSLTGEFIPRGLSTLAGNGRFVEIGKADLWDPARVTAVRADVSYHVVDLARTLRERPAAVRPQLEALLDQVQRGELRPLPHRVFPVQQAVEGFRFMAQARHIGKVVIAQPVTRAAFRADGTYLITGGLRGLGPLVARFMVGHGARNLVLMGRHAPSREALNLIRELEERGARVLVAQADVSSEDGVRAVLAEAGRSLPPLRGVIHSAGLLDDGVLLLQDWSRFAKVMAPKVEGSWNLHRLTQGLDLDFFVLFSSASSLLGSPGQGNHAAANAFLDALAHHRRSRGLPAMSINWGVWSEVGAAAERGVGERATLQGMGTFTPDQGLRVLERLLLAGPAQVGVMPVNWSTLLNALRIQSPFLAEMGAAAAEAARPEISRAAPLPRQPDVRKQIEEAPPSERHRLLVDFVRTCTAKILGLGPSEEIDVRQPLSEMGLDSLMAVELRNVLGSGLRLGKSLPATLVFDQPSIVQLADYLASEALELETADVVEQPAAASAGSGSLLDRIEQLSDEEVERWLDDKGGGAGR